MSIANRAGILVLIVLVATPCFAQEPATPPAGEPAGDPGTELPAAAESSGSSTEPTEPVAAPRSESSASETLESALDREISRAEQALQQIEAHATSIAATQVETSKSISVARATSAAFEARVNGVAGGGQDADRLYDEIVAELSRLRAGLETALDSWNREPSIPRFAARLDPARLDLTEYADRADRLETLYREIAEREVAAAAADRDQRWSTVSGLGQVVQQLDDVRIDGLSQVSPARRRQLLGATREGVDHVRREIDHLVLEARLWRATREKTFGNPAQWLADLFALGSAGLIALRILIVLIVYLLIRGRIRPWLDATRQFSGRVARDGLARRRFDGLLRWLAAVAPWAVFLLFLVVLRRAFGTAAAWPEIDLPLRLAMLYGSYRLVIEATHYAVLAVARRYRLRVTNERTARLLQTVKALTRLGFGVALLLTVAAQLLGKGALYHLVLRLAWVVLAVVILRLVSRWKRTIADTYLKPGRTGPLSRAVAASRDRWTGTFVALVALVWLGGRALVVMARDFTLGFDQTRRALAFIFRRKMEKRAEIQGYAEGDVEQLPEAIRKAFTEAPAAGDLRVDHFPGIDRFTEALHRWREDGTGGTFILTGEYGSGKSSWLGRAADLGGDGWISLTLDDRIRSPKRLAAVLSEALGLEDVEGDLRALQKCLLEGAPREIALDRCQNLFLGVVGGFQTFEAFVNLMEATCRNVFWLCAMDSHAWSYLVAVRPDLNVFRLHQSLVPWTEEQIHELIRVRSEACGLTVTYEDLFAERLERLDARQRSTETDRGYTRLLWDYSNGNPRVALHFWLRSLEADGPTRARVRLFRAPETKELDSLGDQAQFLLAAVVAHENLTLHEASSVTRYPVPLCRIRFERFEDLGVLEPNETDRARVTTHWQRAVLQFLKRRNLIAN